MKFEIEVIGDKVNVYIPPGIQFEVKESVPPQPAPLPIGVQYYIEVGRGQHPQLYRVVAGTTHPEFLTSDSKEWFRSMDYITVDGPKDKTNSCRLVPVATAFARLAFPGVNLI